VQDAFAVRVARSQDATSERGQIATVMAKAVMMVMLEITYGRSAWCGPLWSVWVVLLVMWKMEMVVGDGGCGC
jgi:hypothetical protein